MHQLKVIKQDDQRDSSLCSTIHEIVERFTVYEHSQLELCLRTHHAHHARAQQSECGNVFKSIPVIFAVQIALLAPTLTHCPLNCTLSAAQSETINAKSESNRFLPHRLRFPSPSNGTHVDEIAALARNVYVKITDEKKAAFKLGFYSSQVQGLDHNAREEAGGVSK